MHGLLLMPRLLLVPRLLLMRRLERDPYTERRSRNVMP